MTAVIPDRQVRAVGRRAPVSRGLVTMLVALGLLVIVGFLLAPTSVSKGAVLGMLPFAAVLAIVGIGQTLVVQQGGIDLSVPGAVSLVVVICTHVPNGDNAKLLPAVLVALVVAAGTGVLNGILVGRFGLNAIVATLGINAVLYASVLGVSGGTPRITTSRLASVAGSLTLGIPNAVYFAIATVAVTTVVMKRTVAGRRFEAVGANANAARATGLRVTTHQAGAYIGAQLHYWLAGVLLAGIVSQPTAYQGDSYLLPSVAVVVLGGTSLLGGRGHLVATALAALFLSQLEQFALALGVPYAVRTLVEAAALALGIALYTIDWSGVRRRLLGSAPAT